MELSPPDLLMDGLPPERRRFLRWLHRSYSQTSGIRHFLWRRIRPAGLGLAVVLVISMCLGVGQERSMVYQLFSFAFAMACIGLPWACMRRVKLEAKREMPRFATAGQPLRYGVIVRNMADRLVSRAWLIESEPDARPRMDEFCVIKEPGEEERNFFDRNFVYFRWQWLMLRNRLFQEKLSDQEICLKSGKESRVMLEITPLKRGVIQLQDLRVMLPDPFSLIQKCAKVSAPSSTLIVLPRRYPIPPIQLPGGVPFKISGEANTNALGNSGEFVGLRDYRPEDPMRQIHWKSWARLGRPIVKELEDTHYPRYGLVLDSLSTDRSDVGFEEAISVAASFACAIDTSESLLDLMFVKNEAHRVTVGRGLERAEKLLEVLAGVIPERTGDLKALGRLVLRYRDDLTSCVVILNGWDHLRADLLRMLDQGGLAVVPIIIGLGEKPDGVPGHWLRAGQIAQDLRALPQRFS